MEQIVIDAPADRAANEHGTDEFDPDRPATTFRAGFEIRCPAVPTLLGRLGRRDATVKLISIDPTIVSQDPVSPCSEWMRPHSR